MQEGHVQACIHILQHTTPPHSSLGIFSQSRLECSPANPGIRERQQQGKGNKVSPEQAWEGWMGKGESQMGKGRTYSQRQVRQGIEKGWTSLEIQGVLPTWLSSRTASAIRGLCGSVHVLGLLVLSSVQFTQSCPTLCNPMNHSTPGLPVHHQLLESTQTHVHQVSDAIQPSHPLLSPSPPASNPSQHQSLFQ